MEQRAQRAIPRAEIDAIGYEMPDPQTTNECLQTLDADTCARLGEQFSETGHYQNAIRCFSAAIEKKIDNPWAYAHRGAARGAIRDLTGACSDFEMARRLKGGAYAWADAQEAEAHRLYVWHNASILPPGVLWNLIEKALALFDRALKGGQNTAWTYAHRGATYCLAYWIASSSEACNPHTAFLVQKAECDLTRACDLNKEYSWANSFRAITLTINKQGA
ncbi:MAG TPA: hypothetical protein DCZ95_19520 [Verrucomicrobia bacterium]|nr:hypothetical protein [Verrucomicrobiota bacterium]